MSEHLRVSNVQPVSGDRTEFVLWHDANAEQQYGDYAGRCVFNIQTGAAALHMFLTAGECRALAANLTAMADAIEADTTAFRPKEQS